MIEKASATQEQSSLLDSNISYMKDADKKEKQLNIQMFCQAKCGRREDICVRKKDKCYAMGKQDNKMENVNSQSQTVSKNPS